jgi:hypothetical protein
MNTHIQKKEDNNKQTKRSKLEFLCFQGRAELLNLFFIETDLKRKKREEKEKRLDLEGKRYTRNNGRK